MGGFEYTVSDAASTGTLGDGLTEGGEGGEGRQKLPTLRPGRRMSAVEQSGGSHQAVLASEVEAGWRRGGGSLASILLC